MWNIKQEGSGSLNMALCCREEGYHPAPWAGLYLQCLMTQKSSCCESALFISTTDAHTEQSNTSLRAAAAADSSEKILWELVLICDPGLCPRISFPPIRRQLDDTRLSSTAQRVTLMSGSFNYMLILKSAAISAVGLHLQ